MTSTGGDSSVKLDFGLSDGIISDGSRAAWSHKFELTYSITLSAGELATSLAVRNTEEAAWEFQVLFHTYLKVDVRIPYVQHMMIPSCNLCAESLTLINDIGYLPSVHQRLGRHKISRQSC